MATHNTSGTQPFIWAIPFNGSPPRRTVGRSDHLRTNYSRRQLFSNTAITASPSPRSRGSACDPHDARRPASVVRGAVLVGPKASVHSHGAPSGATAARMIRPTTAPLASTSKSSSFHSPDGREADARLRTSWVNRNAIYGAAFAHTATSGLLGAPLVGQVTAGVYRKPRPY